MLALVDSAEKRSCWVLGDEELAETLPAPP